MALPVNGERGEVALRIGTVDLVIAAEIGRLAALSTALQCRSLADLYERLFGVEVAAVVEGIRCLAIRGDSSAAIEMLTLADFPAAKTAFEAAVTHHLRVEQAGGRKRKSGKSDRSFSLLSWLGAAVSVLGWSPKAFWDSTVTEFAAATAAHAEASRQAHRDAAPTGDEVASLVARYGGGQV